MIYQYEATDMSGKLQPLSKYEGDVLLIVNTASKCGFTPQLDGLETLYAQYKDQGLQVLGFPCNQFGHQDPGTNEEINEFCQLNYGVSFPMFAKVDVNGKDAHPLSQYLAKEAPGLLGSKAIKWNFTKILIDRHGNVIERFSPQTTPAEIESAIKKLI